MLYSMNISFCPNNHYNNTLLENILIISDPFVLSGWRWHRSSLWIRIPTVPWRYVFCYISYTVTFFLTLLHRVNKSSFELIIWNNTSIPHSSRIDIICDNVVTVSLAIIYFLLHFRSLQMGRSFWRWQVSSRNGEAEGFRIRQSVWTLPNA